MLTRLTDILVTVWRDTLELTAKQVSGHFGHFFHLIPKKVLRFAGLIKVACAQGFLFLVAGGGGGGGECNSGTYKQHVEAAKSITVPFL